MPRPYRKTPFVVSLLLFLFLLFRYRASTSGTPRDTLRQQQQQQQQQQLQQQQRRRQAVQRSPARNACVFEDHLVTDKNWYGYLANVTLETSGGMTFDFLFPARSCCINVLFYEEEQAALLRQNSKCWEKEGLVTREDQILRLTPKFSWSGCHVTSVDGVEAYACRSGRSFSKERTTWFIAVSNCDTIYGLDLRYRIEIFGDSGQCKSILPSRSTLLDKLPPVEPQRQGDPRRTNHQPPRVVSSPRSPGKMDLHPAEDERPLDEGLGDGACLIGGVLNVTDSNWFGFLGNFSLKPGGGFRFRFAYPHHMQVQHVVLYFEEDLPSLYRMEDCWEKEGVLRSHQVDEQIIDLSPRSSWNGCSTGSGDPHLHLTPLILQTPQWPGHAWFGLNLTCRGRRTFDRPRTLHVAVSNCRSKIGLLLDYEIEVHGFGSYDGRADSCSAGSRFYEPVVVVVSFLAVAAAVVVVDGGGGGGGGVKL